MKILHAADLHFMEAPAVLEDIKKCTNFTLSFAEKEKPDITVITGDIFDEELPLDSPAVIVAVDFISRLGDIAPTLIVKGTHSHDCDSLHIFRKVKTAYPIYVSDRLEQVVYTDHGFMSLDDSSHIKGDVKVVISCLPSVTKAHVLNIKGVSDIHEGNSITADLLRDVFAGWGIVNSNAKHMGVPAIICGHGTVTGATLSTGQQMVGRDIEFGTGDIDMANTDVCCLGHIHKAQSFGNVFYSGSITRLNFGEVEDKGFFIHEVGPSGRLSSRFINTPCRKMVTLDITAADDIQNVDVENAFVRVRYEVSEEKVHIIDDEAIKKVLLSKGAESVVVNKTVKPVNSVRAAGISGLNTLEEKLKKYADAVSETLPEGVFEKVKLLDKSVQDILAFIEPEEAKAAQEYPNELQQRMEGQCGLFA